MNRHFRDARRPAALAAAVVLLVAACTSAPASPGFTDAPTSSAGAPSPSASTTPVPASPSASPTPSSPSEPALTFTPGTVAQPRIVELAADDKLNFTPGFVQAAVGETVTFRIHNTGTAVHEFMIGPLTDAFADTEGTPEVADIAGGASADLTLTLDGTGPFGFACHAPGHFEHGMAGYIQLVGPGAPTIGTAVNPRLVHLDMTDKLAFLPADIEVRDGEAVRFVVTNSGTAVHEIQVGPADKVAADEVDGTIVVEKDALDAGSTHAVDYTFKGAGPYAFACHEPGHYEAGMKGTVTVIGS